MDFARCARHHELAQSVRRRNSIKRHPHNQLKTGN
jgi:hypothetical protein